MVRVLILCTHNSARSQMGEGLLRFLAAERGLELEVHSAGTEATAVKESARVVMGELGIDLRGHTSKTLFDLPDPWNFDYVITVCDSAAENCPNYPAKTTRRHYPFTDPSGGSLGRWREVRDQLRAQLLDFVTALEEGREAPGGYHQAPPVRAS